MTNDTGWLETVWPFVRDSLPPAPCDVLEIGCGTLGGFVPALLKAGHRATGVDPDAPVGPHYRRTRIEDHRPPGLVQAVVACTSLHHVDDLDQVLERVTGMLEPGGTLVVVEWAWERFDEATARWCFTQLADQDPTAEPNWLLRLHDEWAVSGQSWRNYVQSWGEEEGLHRGWEILDALNARFDRRTSTMEPYFFSDLDDASEADEQRAIDQGLVRATGIRYVADKSARAPTRPGDGSE